MKKYLCLLLAAAMLLCVLAACDTSGLLNSGGLVGDMLGSWSEKEDEALPGTKDDDIETVYEESVLDVPQTETDAPVTEEVTWLDTETEGTTAAVTYPETESDIPFETELETEPELDQAALALLQLNVDWNGEEFLILGRADHVPEELESESRTDVLQDAVYRRNLTFEQYCNLHLGVIYEDTYSVSARIKSDVYIGAGEIDLVYHHMAETAKLAFDGLLLSYTKLDGVDLSAPWWDQGTADLTIADQIYFMNGALNYSDEETTYAMLFNKAKVMDEKKIDPYAMVNCNEWTLDRFQSVIRDASSDLNGDDIYSCDDAYGFVANWETGNVLFYGSDLRYVANKKGEYPTLALDDDGQKKASDLLDQILLLYYDGHDTFVSDPGEESQSLDCFKQDRAMFMAEIIQYVKPLSAEMQNEFGVLPIPKYNASQERYLTWTNGVCSTVSVTSAVTEHEKHGKTLEILAILSHQSITPVYYEGLLKQNTEHEEAAKGMLDIIFAGRVYDLSMYFSEFEFDEIYKTMLSLNRNSFATAYPRKAKIAQKELKNLIEQLEKKQ